MNGCEMLPGRPSLPLLPGTSIFMEGMPQNNNTFVHNASGGLLNSKINPACCYQGCT